MAEDLKGELGKHWAFKRLDYLTKSCVSEVVWLVASEAMDDDAWDENGDNSDLQEEWIVRVYVLDCSVSASSCMAIVCNCCHNFDEAQPNEDECSNLCSFRHNWLRFNAKFLVDSCKFLMVSNIRACHTNYHREGYQDSQSWNQLDTHYWAFNSTGLDWVWVCIIGMFKFIYVLSLWLWLGHHCLRLLLNY